MQNILRKKYSFKGNTKEKKFMLLEKFPAPAPTPHNFANGPSLNKSAMHSFVDGTAVAGPFQKQNSNTTKNG